MKVEHFSFSHYYVSLFEAGEDKTWTRGPWTPTLDRVHGPPVMDWVHGQFFFK